MCCPHEYVHVHQCAGLVIATGHKDNVDVLLKHTSWSLAWACKSSWLVAVDSPACRHAHAYKEWLFLATCLSPVNLTNLIKCVGNSSSYACSLFYLFVLLKHPIYHNGLMCCYYPVRICAVGYAFGHIGLCMYVCICGQKY